MFRHARKTINSSVSSFLTSTRRSNSPKRQHAPWLQNPQRKSPWPRSSLLPTRKRRWMMRYSADTSLASNGALTIHQQQRTKVFTKGAHKSPTQVLRLGGAQCWRLSSLSRSWRRMQSLRRSILVKATQAHTLLSMRIDTHNSRFWGRDSKSAFELGVLRGGFVGESNSDWLSGDQIRSPTLEEAINLGCHGHDGLGIWVSYSIASMFHSSFFSTSKTA